MHEKVNENRLASINSQKWLMRTGLQAQFMQEVDENRMNGEEMPTDGTKTHEEPGADARSTRAQGEQGEQTTKFVLPYSTPNDGHTAEMSA